MDWNTKMLELKLASNMVRHCVCIIFPADDWGIEDSDSQNQRWDTGRRPLHSFQIASTTRKQAKFFFK